MLQEMLKKNNSGKDEHQQWMRMKKATVGWSRKIPWWWNHFLWTCIIASAWTNYSIHPTLCQDVNIFSVIFTKWKYVLQCREAAVDHKITFDWRVGSTAEKSVTATEVSTALRRFRGCPDMACIQICIQVTEPTRRGVISTSKTLWLIIYWAAKM